MTKIDRKERVVLVIKEIKKLVHTWLYKLEGDRLDWGKYGCFWTGGQLKCGSLYQSDGHNRKNNNIIDCFGWFWPNLKIFCLSSPVHIKMSIDVEIWF